MTHSKTRYYVLALLTIGVWSSTFISTKVLLGAFTPVEILVYRFTLAWMCMFLLYPRVHRPEGWKTELRIFLAGVSGGSLYFLAENFALEISTASNVSLLVSTAPILTALGAHFLLRDEKLQKRILLGALVAFVGAALVILNGKFVLNLNPRGDFLALTSALAWAGYSILVKNLRSAHSTFYVTRKIFFWTVITALPAHFISPIGFDLRPLLTPVMGINMLFLTLFASCGAYVIWTKVIWAMGATRANNFIYFIPLLTFALAIPLLGERITPFALGGAALIVTGVWITAARRKAE